MKVTKVGSLVKTAENLPIVSSPLKQHYYVTSISFHKKLGLLSALNVCKAKIKLFVKANNWIIITLSSPWKTALDQSMTFYEVLSEQWQTLRLSTPTIDNKKIFTNKRLLFSGQDGIHRKISALYNVYAWKFQESKTIQMHANIHEVGPI